MEKFYPQSHLNHYSYYDPSPGLQLTEFYRRPTETIGTPFEESVRACRLIYERFNKPLVICLSGGLDSECLAQAAEASGVPYSIAIMRLLPDFNRHDIVFAEEYCRHKKLTPRYYDLDIIYFYESGEFMEYAMKYRTNSPQFAAHLWMVDQIEDGTVVLGGSNPYLNHYDSNGNVLEASTLFTPEDKEYATDRLFQKKNKPGVGHFFQYTPELYFSFLFCTIAGADRETRRSYELADHYEFKKEIYRQAGFDDRLFVNRTQKYTGFEEVKNYYASLYGVGDIYEKLFRLPLQLVYPTKKSVRTLIPASVESNFYRKSQP